MLHLPARARKRASSSLLGEPAIAFFTAFSTALSERASGSLAGEAAPEDAGLVPPPALRPFKVWLTCAFHAMAFMSSHMPWNCLASAEGYGKAFQGETSDMDASVTGVLVCFFSLFKKFASFIKFLHMNLSFNNIAIQLVK